MCRQAIQVFDASGAVAATFDAWVDMATAYTWLPRSLAERLGLDLTESRVFVLADGTRQRKPVAQVRISLGGPAFYTYCALVDEGEELLVAP
jgi:predicted aspartyl protease